MHSPNGCPQRDLVYQFKDTWVSDFFHCPHVLLLIDLPCYVPVTPSSLVRAPVLSKVPKHNFLIKKKESKSFYHHLKSWSKTAPIVHSGTICTWGPPSSCSPSHSLGGFLLEPLHQLLQQQSHTANQQRAFGERKLVLIHPHDGKKENAVSSFAKVQIMSKEFKKRAKGGRVHEGFVYASVCMGGRNMTTSTVLMLSRGGVLQTNCKLGTSMKCIFSHLRSQRVPLFKYVPDTPCARAN